MNNPVLILYLEDNPRDAELVRDKLQQIAMPHELRIESDRAEYEAALAQTRFDLILSDYALPGYDGMTALALAREKQPDVPFILISGTLGEERAVDCVVRGATDYVLKQNLNRLVPAVLRALTEAEEHQKRRVAEKALLKSEERNRVLIENSHDIIYTLTPDGVLDFVSPAWTTFLGHTAEHVTGFPLRSFIHPDDLAGCEVLLKSVIETGQRKSGVEYRVKHSDGSWYWHSTSACPLKDAAGNVTGFEGIARDITERKQAEDKLRESENKFRSYIECAPDGVFVLDGAGRYVEVNTSACQVLGYSREEMQQFSIRDLLAEESLEDGLAHFKRLIETGEATSDIWHKHKDGSQRCLTISAVKLSETRILGFGKDITERKRAEEELRESKALIEAVVENIPLMLFLKEAKDLRFVIFNRAGEELLGYDRKALLGRNNLDLFPPEQAAHFMAKDREVLDGETGMLDIPEEPVLTAKKGQRLLHTRKICIRGGDGKTKFLLGISEDITERKQAEVEREQMQAQLIQSQKLEAIGTLASGVAHEINNPIMGIMNYAQLILDRLGPDSPVSEYATEIGKETERVATIVKNLLTFARQDKETHSSPARMCDIVQGTLSLVGAVMRHDQIALEVDVPEDLPPIKCRSQQIQQVITNLLTNARDALNQRYPGHDVDKVVRVSARVIEKAVISDRLSVTGDRLSAEESGPNTEHRTPNTRRILRLTVEDHGAGIPEGLRARIFEPFFTTKPRDKGTGLGLSISHGIVKDHHGELSVETQVGEWTRFHVDLPV